MEWKLTVIDQDNEIVIGPEFFPRPYLAYQRLLDITGNQGLFAEYSKSKGQGFSLRLQIALMLDQELPELVMEKRGRIVNNHGDPNIEWVERPADERPFRIRIVPDYGAYAWSEYGLSWYVDYAFPDNPIAEQLDKDFLEWLAIFENTDIDNNGRTIINFSWEEFHRTGIALAKRLKALGKDDIVVFYEKLSEDTFLIEEIQIIR